MVGRRIRVALTMVEAIEKDGAEPSHR